ncbi:MAG: quinone-dependent dihydroorotate dehydrogenase [Synechococcales bacterium]|nr:quinone-dependent dihydroorotate dehydrogenase [Synechococcales bacterium]
MGTELYRTVVRPLLFSGLRADPEMLHQQSMRGLSWLSDSHQSALTRWLQQQFQQTFGWNSPRLCQSLWGLNFSNPLGLAAGFDKNGQAIRAWSSLGFGFAELGTVTFSPQPGNPKPRLFRLLSDQAAINRMGFNNDGAAALAERLKAVRRQGEISNPIGVNLGKSKATPLEKAVEDYLASFRLLQEWGDYFVVNVSSPNTPGLRSLQATDHLHPLLMALQAENHQAKPLLIKISPDLDWEAIAAIIDLAQTHQLAGIIATNTTIQRQGLKTRVIAATGKAVEDEPGGLSGPPLRQRATEVIRFIYQQTQGTLPIIGVGGIASGDDAWEKIAAGASLIQLYTGWIYEGPWLIKQILTSLDQRLQTQGFQTIVEAVGCEAYSNPAPEQ